VGRVLSLTLLAELPELGRLSHREIAPLIGVAPLNRVIRLIRAAPGRREAREGRPRACMRKVLSILNAMVRHQTPWRLTTA
jgi:transposase